MVDLNYSTDDLWKSKMCTRKVRTNLHHRTDLWALQIGPDQQKTDLLDKTDIGKEEIVGWNWSTPEEYVGLNWPAGWSWPRQEDFVGETGLS
jgi:hypothetical protein